jgi:hypothetical protein
MDMSTIFAPVLKQKLLLENAMQDFALINAPTLLDQDHPCAILPE